MRPLLALLLPLALAAPTSAQPAEGDASGRILLVLTSHSRLGDTGKTTGFYLSEASHPHHVFTQAGYAVDIATPGGDHAPVDPKSFDMDDEHNRAFLGDADVQASLQDPLAPREVDAADYDAVFFAGGHGTMWDFPNNDGLQRLAAAIYESGGVVAAVCHGPAALANLRLSDGAYLVDGKSVTGFTNEEEAAVGLTDAMPFLLESRLRERGAHWVEAPNFQERVVVSERLVTGQNPASATGAAEAVVELLRSAPATRPVAR